MDNKIIREIKLTNRSKIVISTGDFNGKSKVVRVDVRTMVKNDAKDEKWIWTQKGINFPIDKLDEIIGSLKEVKKL